MQNDISPRDRFATYFTIPKTVPLHMISPGPQPLSKEQIAADLAIFAAPPAQPAVATSHAKPTPPAPQIEKADSRSSKKRARPPEVVAEGFESEASSAKRQQSVAAAAEKNQPSVDQPAWVQPLFAAKTLDEAKSVLLKAGYQLAADDSARPRDGALQAAIVSAIQQENKTILGATWLFATWNEFVAGAKEACNAPNVKVSDPMKAYVFQHLLQPGRKGLAQFKMANRVFSETEQNRLALLVL